MILATNDDLGKAVAEGRFRQDLFYRINVINIELPPLRERISDIPLLAEHFLKQVCEDAGKTVRGFTDEAMAALQRYRWPGNVRELQNVIERAVLLGKSEQIGLEDLPADLIAAGPVAHRAGRQADAESRRWRPPSGRSSSRCSKLEPVGTATPRPRLLGINRTTLYKKMKRLGLEEPQVALGR